MAFLDVEGDHDEFDEATKWPYTLSDFHEYFIFDHEFLSSLQYCFVNGPVYISVDITCILIADAPSVSISTYAHYRHSRWVGTRVQWKLETAANFPSCFRATAWKGKLSTSSEESRRSVPRDAVRLALHDGSSGERSVDVNGVPVSQAPIKSPTERRKI